MNEKFSKFFRMWHRKDSGDWCHAWDIEEKAFQKWKEGGVLSSINVVLPNGLSPQIGSRVICGTCGNPPGQPPPAMRRELMTSPRGEKTE